jgi:ABC-type branched-subunit amino acid transport system substrate-binding protein/uncharacterized protein YgiM (DUF1202 family)
MIQQRHKQLPLLTLLLFTLLVLMAFAPVYAQDQPTFRIGVIDEERGPLSSGALLAVQQINDAGGVLGADGTLFRLELVIEPASGDGTITDAVDNLNAADVIAVLGPITSATALSNLQALQSLNVPVLTPAVSDTLLASDTTDLIFRSRAVEVLHGRALATFLINDLNIDNIATVQLDPASTAGVVGFSTAAGSLGVAVRTPIIYDFSTEISTLARNVISTNPQAVVIYGPPELSALLYIELLVNNYRGLFVYPQAESAEFRGVLPVGLVDGVVTVSTWSPSLTDLASTEFTLDYVRQLGTVPTAISAAAYDSITMIAAALGQPGDLADNLRSLENVRGVQGILNPAGLADGETSNNVVVQLMGTLGAGQPVVRFAGNERLTDTGAPGPEQPLQPSPTPTPDGVVGTVISAVLNVRSGPGTNFDILGQLRQGEQVRILGANIDFSWAVIEFRGQQAWISTASNLIEVFGNRNLVPIVAAPPTPTPAPATATPPVTDFPDLVILDAQPTVIPFNTPISVTVTVANIGGQSAGPFAVATSFQPGDAYAAFNLSGLAAGQSTTIQLPFPAVAQTGNFEVVIIPDLNQQVDEGPIGEANNYSFVYRYRIDRPATTNVASLVVGSTLALDIDNDLVLSADGLRTVSTCNGTTYCVGLLSPGLNFDTAYYDAISPANGISSSFIPNISLTPGAVIGVLTSTGARAVMRVDSVNPGVSVSFTYRVY